MLIKNLSFKKPLYFRCVGKSFLIIIVILVTTVNLTWGQKKFVSLKSQIETADSLLIVGHENTNEIPGVDIKTGRVIPSPKLIEKGRLNYQIINQKVIIKKTSLQRLIEILTRPFEDTLIEDGKCFIPQHGIIIFKTKKVSYIDICFSCSHIVTSKDIKISDEDFDRRKWKELVEYFLQEGITYNMTFWRNEGYVVDGSEL